jgi:aminoglycoside phosphotransferase (APT) family kinase protein
MIPENKKNAVIKALQTTFAVSGPDDIHQLTAGLSSALVFKITVQRRDYLLRVITRTDAMSDPTHEYNCMQTAAEAGIAPRVWYVDATDKIAITDFVDAKPFPIEQAKTKMPALLRNLHSLPPFPYRVNYLDAIDMFIKKFKAANLLPDDITVELFDTYAKIKNVYPLSHEDQVACHNDLKPENTLFDGGRVWLVDWEAAFLNDRYMDLAIAANFVVRDDNDEQDYLAEYFGRQASSYEHARFFLMQQMLHLSYFVVFMLQGNTPGKPIDVDMPKPGFREFHDLVWIGKISLADMDARIQYALVHMEQLKDNLRLKRFEESMNLVSNYSPA